MLSIQSSLVIITEKKDFKNKQNYSRYLNIYEPMINTMVSDLYYICLDLNKYLLQILSIKINI